MTSAAHPDATLREEHLLLRSGRRLVVGMDEVGRGSLAGPVSVGAVAVDSGTGAAPRGIQDSKLLRPAARTTMAPLLRDWALAAAVGHAEPAEIDAWGIIAALRLAGRRALAGLGIPAECVLLDGSHDWLTDPAVGQELLPAPGADVPEITLVAEPEVRTLVKGDRRCATIAAASILAKVERDTLMTQLAQRHPEFGWQRFKGYASAEHVAALRAHGPSPLHRRSWRLPT